MSEMALMTPILVALLAGMMLAGFYAFRAAASDWGIFITGVTSGAFDHPATEQARASILWGDIRGSLDTGTTDLPRTTRSKISIEYSRPFIFGIHLIEAQRGQSFFRLWRFYPGPPQGQIQ